MPMTERVTPRRHGSYGIDAPYAPAFIAVMTVVVLVMAFISGHWQTFAPITFMLAVLGFYLHSTLRGKFVVWADLLDQLQLRVMSEFWTWDVAGVRSCSWPLNV